MFLHLRVTAVTQSNRFTLCVAGVAAICLGEPHIVFRYSVRFVGSVNGSFQTSDPSNNILISHVWATVTNTNEQDCDNAMEQKYAPD